MQDISQTGARTKKEIRKRIREERSRLTVEETEAYSAEICRKICDLPEYREATAVLCYMAFRNEVNLKNVMLTSWREGKKIFLPRMDADILSDAGSGQMEFFLHAEEDELPVNAMGIPEPRPDRPAFPELCEAGERVLMIMPGVVFDRERRRLGYGGGFYDRYLSQVFTDNEKNTETGAVRKLPEIRLTTMAVAYELQLVDDPLPEEETDIRPDLLITEKYIYR